MALRILWALTLRETQTLSHADTFLAFGLCFVLITLIAPLLCKVAPLMQGSTDAH